MKIYQSILTEVMVIEPPVFGDQRGFFLETFHQDVFHNAGINEQFVQDNHSRSRRGVLRGLHYQLAHPQGKLVRVARGRVFDVAVDVRTGSPNFGKWFGVILDEDSMRMLYVPPGFAQDFVVLSDTADFIFRCTDYYDPESEQGILWNNPQIGIDWPDIEVVLSEKDNANKMLSEQPVCFLPKYSG